MSQPQDLVTLATLLALGVLVLEQLLNRRATRKRREARVARRLAALYQLRAPRPPRNREVAAR